ncbi:type II secretion system protein GspM [Pseudomonas sp. FW300-N2F2]|uniref:type II secretion system protein GspM n=1 Tax=Pseudomonas sp. FW300-N2F2 TaxID=2751320 RepID=UPI001A90E28C|nr:type II secretion system protein GspM [Pseudomonas sp. FW300-N2F2]
MYKTRRAQRFYAIALVILMGTFLYWVLLHWWFIAPLQQMAEEVEVLQVSYQRFSTLEAQRGFIQAELESVTRRPLPSEGLLTADEPEVATAQLMQLVSERLSLEPATGIACTVLSRSPQTATPNGQLLQIKVNVDMECGIESLAGTLHRLESEQPYLVVDTLSIQRAPNSTGAQDQQGHLVVKMQVSGLLSAMQAAGHE